MTHMPNIVPSPDAGTSTTAVPDRPQRGGVPVVQPPRRDLRIALPLGEMAARILRQDHGSAVRTVMVTGAERRVGTSLVAGGLAESLGGGPERVLLIQVTGDLFEPDQVRQLMVLPEPTALDRGVWRRTLSGTALMALLSARGASFAELSRQLLDRFDQVVWDMPPPLDSPVTVVAGSMMDGVILVVKANHTPSDVARRAADRLRENQARLLGVALNQVRSYVPRWMRRRP